MSLRGVITEEGREHPLVTPCGTLYLEVKEEEQLLVTSGRYDEVVGGPLATLRSWGVEKSIELDGRRFEVRLQLYRHPDGHFQIGKPGEKIHHADYGDYWVETKSKLYGVPLLWRLTYRGNKKRSERIAAAAVVAANDWVRDHGVEFNQALAVVRAEEREHERQQVERRLERLEKERQQLEAELNGIDVDISIATAGPVEPHVRSRLSGAAELGRDG